MSVEAAPLEHPSTIEGTEFPEFYNRCCTAHAHAAKPTGQARIDGMKAILVSAASMWENGKTLTVGFVKPVPGTPVQQAKVKEVVKQWEAVANIKFKFITNGSDANIRVSFQRNAGSWSTVGKDAFLESRSNPTMNFGWVLNGNSITPKERGVILHEFGHAIGYLHEHQSPRRGEKLTLNEALIIEEMKVTQVPPWTEQDTRDNILNIYTEQEVSNFSAVDFTSIMMYFMPAEWNTQGIEIEVNNDLSPLDKAFAFLNYPFMGGASPLNPNVNLENALNVVGITGTYKDNITAAYAAGDWKGVRAEFTRWSVNKKASAAQAAGREAIAAAVPAAAIVAVGA